MKCSWEPMISSYFWGRKELILGVDYAGPAFAYRVPFFKMGKTIKKKKKKRKKDFTEFFSVQHYDISY